MKIFKNLKKLNSFSNIGRRNLIATEFCSNHLKIACLKTFSNKNELARLFYRDIAGLPDIDISRMIRSCINELDLKNATVIDVIPSNLVITKNIEVPSTNPKEIREIINLQASRHTPYSREEIIIDYIELGTYKHSYTKILLIILARSVIKKQFEILEKSGLRLKRVILAPESIARFIPKIIKLENEDTSICIAHIDAIFTDFNVVFKNKPIFIRSIPIGAEHLRDEWERYQVRFVEELRKSLESYQSENIEKGPNLFILTGAIEELKGIENILDSALHLPVRIVSYFTGLNVSSDILREVSLAKCASFLDVVASGLCLDEMKVDLIPDEIKMRRNLEEKGRDLIKTGSYIMTIFVLIIFILVNKIYFKGAYLKDIDKKYQSLDQEAKKLEKSFTEVSLIRNYLLNRGYSLEVLVELHNLAPLNLKLDDIRYDTQAERFSFRGTTEVMSVVFSFVDSMEKSKLFKDVKIKYTSKRKDGTKDVADFEIICALEKDSQG
ncbi:MAG: pilus assembly protein PilM [Candidatus Omnitrophica bacterium]|nr:pilus assembly protein PilM [Candidatus Omnitrophota bacterium]